MLEIFHKNKKGEGASPQESSAGRTDGQKGRTLHGVVVSDKMNKTRVVAITELKKHAKYKKYFKTTKKFKAHDEHNEYKTNDKVVLKETRPLSREKRWQIIGKV